MEVLTVFLVLIVYVELLIGFLDDYKEPFLMWMKDRLVFVEVVVVFFEVLSSIRRLYRSCLKYIKRLESSMKSS